MNFFRFLIFGLTAVLLSFIQFLPISIFGVKPNVALAGLIVLFFFSKDVWQNVFLTALAAAVLKFSPQPAKEILVFLAVALAALLVKEYLPWHQFVSGLFLIISATLLFYLALYPKMVLSFTFLLEVFYNLFFGAIFFGALSSILKPSRKL